MVEQFIQLLQSKDMVSSAEEVADILWLAQYLPRSQSPVTTTSLEQPVVTVKDEKPKQLPNSHVGSKQNKRPKTQVYIPSSQGEDIEEETVPARIVRLPAAPALLEALEIGRVLRPFIRRVPSRTRFLLDEEATAQHIADTKDWTPILYPEPVRWLDLALVVDESTSMHIWQQTILEFQQLLERQGMFRSVKLWGVRTGLDIGDIHFHSGFQPLPQSYQRRDLRELVNQQSQLLILVISDCVSSAWHNGTMAALLTTWAKDGLVSIIQMLPEALWPRTALRNFVPVVLQGRYPGTPNRNLQCERMFRQVDQQPFTGIGVPVVPLEPTTLALWAQVVAGNKQAWVRGILLQPDGGILKSIDASTPAPSSVSRPPIASEELLRIFHATASPVARQLAGYLASLRLLTLPIIHLIQRIFLPEARHIHIAEVLLSGLIRKATPHSDTEVPSSLIVYRFVSEVIRDRLRHTIRISESEQVIDIIYKLSEYISEQKGQNSDFQALIKDYAGDSSYPLSTGYQLVARISLDSVQAAIDGDTTNLIPSELDGPVRPIADSDGHIIGVGFVVHHDEHYFYVVTCRHVLDNVASRPNAHITVDGRSAEIFCYDQSSFDLAILRGETHQLDADPLPLRAVGKSGMTCKITTFRGGDKYLIVQEGKGTLDKEVLINCDHPNLYANAWWVETDREVIHATSSGTPVLNENGEVVAVLSMAKESGKRGLAISIEALRHVWKEMPSHLLPPVHKPDLLQEPGPLMNCEKEIEAFYELLDNSSTMQRIILLQGGHGCGKTRLLTEYRRLVVARQRKVISFDLHRQLSIEHCLERIVDNSADPSRFTAFEQNLRKKKPESLSRQTDWHEELTRAFFTDLHNQRTTTPIFVFFDSLEKADRRFRNWLFDEFVTRLADRPIMAVLASHTELDRLQHLEWVRFFALKIPNIESFYKYAAQFGVELEPTVMNVLFNAFQATPKSFVDYVDAMRLQQGQSI